jgi:hypothetical protein
MPRVTDNSYPLHAAADMDDDDVALVVRDGEVGRLARAGMRDWLRSDAGVRAIVAAMLQPGDGVQITPLGESLTLTINVNVGGGTDIDWTNGAGPVVTAPNGTKYRVGVSNAGAITLTALGVPTLTTGGFATGTVLSTPITTDLNLMASVKPGGWVRSDYSWKTIQPTSAASFTWTEPDARIDAVHAAGMKVLAMLGYSPAWANGGQTDDKFPPASGFTAQWQEFCRQFALRYIPRGVTVFELWNEANLQRFWKPAPNIADYVNRVLVPGAAGLRAAATSLGVSITIITAGTAPATNNGTNIDPRTWVTGLYSNSGKAHFDALGHHPYTWPFSPDENIAVAPGSFSPNQWNTMIQTRDLRATMLANTDGAKKIWATEVGLPSRDAAPTYPTTGHQNFVSHTLMATRIAQIADFWFGMPTGGDLGWAGPLIWYQHRNQSAEPLGTNTEGGFGIVYNSGTDKPNGVRAALQAKLAQYA